MNTICIFLKSPSVGGAKSRLAKELGPGRAAAIYQVLVERQLAELPAGWPVSVYFTPSASKEEMKLWLTAKLTAQAHFVSQSEGDLGSRLKKALETEFKRGSERVYLIGSDCPGLSRRHFHQAEAALSRNDLVIGPAEDGGYVLIGLKCLHRTLFENIDWSTAAVLKQTVAAAERQNLSVSLLESLIDVDDAASLFNAAKTFPFLRERSENQ